MRLYLQFICFVFYISVSQQSIFNRIKNNVISLFDEGAEGDVRKKEKLVTFGHNGGNNPGEGKSVLNNIADNILSFIKRSTDNQISKKHTDNEKPFFNGLSRFIDMFNERANKSEHDKLNKKIRVKKFKPPKSYRNSLRGDSISNSLRESDGRRRYSEDSSSSLSSSSSRELKHWKDEWREEWIKKKLEAINSTRPKGDVVNMVAARPWGVPCGDPNQHDMPWGTCMLAMECDAEYRIYRGDYFCGRTQFVCCALELNTYDMYQGFDVSFADSSLSTDSEELKDRNRSSKEGKRRRRRKERRRRKRNRRKRKRKIKKNIRKIVNEIRKILNRSYRNGTNERKRKTKRLKKFIKDLKKKYRKDRQSVKIIHETEMIKVDNALQKKLNEIKQVNKDFVRNGTFRDIVVNGTINKKGARMLVQAYPELSNYIDARRTGDVQESKDYLQYDIEYGLLYY